MARYILPELQYDYGALEPHLSAKIVELHHGKHHRAYVTGANETLEKLAEARSKNDHASIGGLERLLAFNVSGHVLHSLYWQNLAPKAGGRPAGALAQAIDRDFGKFDSFKNQLNQAAATVLGSGWAALVWDPVLGSLNTVQIHDHQSQTIQGGVPLMVIDAWEHAWYLQHQTEKAKHFDALWNLWNWSDISARFEAAQKLDLKLNRVAERGR